MEGSFEGGDGPERFSVWLTPEELVRLVLADLGYDTSRTWRVKVEVTAEGISVLAVEDAAA